MPIMTSTGWAPLNVPVYYHEEGKTNSSLDVGDASAAACDFGQPGQAKRDKTGPRQVNTRQRKERGQTQQGAASRVDGPGRADYLDQG